jgi:hypothetical protein
MPTIEERVAYLEGQVSEQSHAQLEIRDAVRSLEHRMDSRFEAVDRRFESIDRRFDVVDRRIDALDEKVTRQVESLDGKMSRQFMWLVGIQVTTLAAIIGALLSRA